MKTYIKQLLLPHKIIWRVKKMVNFYLNPISFEDEDWADADYEDDYEDEDYKDFMDVEED